MSKSFGVRYGVTAGLEVSQPLFNKQLFTAIKSTTALKDHYQLNTLKTTQDLVENIAKLYLQIQVTDLQRDIAEANYARIDQLVVISQAQLDNGLIKRTDLNQLKVNQANSQTQLEDISFSKQQESAFTTIGQASSTMGTAAYMAQFNAKMISPEMRSVSSVTYAQKIKDELATQVPGAKFTTAAVSMVGGGTARTHTGYSYW